MKIRLITVAFALGLAVQASAGVLFFTSEADFDAHAVTMLTDFEGIVADNDFTSGDPLIVDGISFDQAGGGVVAICGKDSSCTGSPYESAFLGTNNGNQLNIDLTGVGPGITAFGGIFGDADSGPTPATIRLFGPGGLLDTQNVMVGDMGLGLPKTFFGWYTTGGDTITNIEFDMVGAFESVDDIRVGRVPEPASILIMGPGALLLGFVTRKRRRV